ncbi:hypothetical protein [Kangiella sp. TOML190]|uniref:hypothetical protein n=1 Tax=Kangiella sp. TOML190 TaxID=2931351 RepID=UPI002041E11F|nr:hypothetical protein [Kangiella sp. TOML190]
MKVKMIALVTIWLLMSGSVLLKDVLRTEFKANQLTEKPPSLSAHRLANFRVRDNSAPSCLHHWLYQQFER